MFIKIGNLVINTDNVTTIQLAGEHSIVNMRDGRSHKLSTSAGGYILESLDADTAFIDSDAIPAVSPKTAIAQMLRDANRTYSLSEIYFELLQRQVIHANTTEGAIKTLLIELIDERVIKSSAESGRYSYITTAPQSSQGL